MAISMGANPGFVKYDAAWKALMPNRAKPGESSAKRSGNALKTPQTGVKKIAIEIR